MISITKKAIYSLILPFLMANLTSIGMDNPTKKEMVVRPTIKAKIYFAPKKPAFYLTGAQLEHLKEKGIPTPTIGIGRTVEKVEVIESDGSTTNWRNNTTEKIHTYESKKLRQEKLSFAERMQKNLALDNLTFPHTLPVELTFNCSNGSCITLTINGFPVQATLESTKNFHTEQTKCMQKFYEKAASHLSQHEILSLINEGKLTETTNTLPVTILGIPTILSTKNYIHGPNGCSNEKRFINLMSAKQTKHHKNSAFHLVQNRQIRTRAGQCHPNPQINLDLILNNSLEDILSAERMNKAALDVADEKLLSDCFNDFKAQEDITKELTNQHAYLPQNRSDRHGNECILL